MNKNYSRYIYAGFIVVLLLVVSKGVAAKSFIWKTQSDTATVYLLGSVHMGVQSMYPMPQSIENAYKDSEIVVVEIN